jgi:predicted PurR-regulated permease PerM
MTDPQDTPAPETPEPKAPIAEVEEVVAAFEKAEREEMVADRTTRIGQWFLLILAVLISVVFYRVIEPFVMALFLAAIFAGMSYPLYQALVKRTRGAQTLSALITLMAAICLVVVPTILFVGILAGEAVTVSQSVGPWIEGQMDSPGSVDRLVGNWARGLPVVGDLIPEREVVIGKLGEFAGRLGGFLVASLASATRGTATFFLQLFVMLYSMYFFLIRGREAMRNVLYLIPLNSAQEDQLVSRFVSVTRATIKGSLVIGLLQGALAGLGFFVAGIGGSIFWGTIMAVLSVIPAVGAALIWIPAVIYLLAVGKVGVGIGLLLWCLVIVSSVDNILRPILVGRDTEMPDVLVLLSTLGGIAMFGIMGVIVGPIVAALFLTVWNLYGEAFHEYLPDVTGPVA